MTNLWNDLRYGARLLAKNPGFTGVAVVVLALGIGANTAVFSLVNALLLTPLPTQRAGIVGVFASDRTVPDSYRELSYQEYRQIREAREVFASVMAHASTMVGVTEGETTRREFVSLVTSNFFSTLDVTPAAGREFTAEEERPGSNIAVVIVSYDYARRTAGTPEQALGRTVRINTRPFTVVGVTPEGFTGVLALIAEDFWLPLGVYATVTADAARGAATSLNDPATRALVLVARLRPGLPPERADPVLATLTSRLRESDPGREANLALSLHRLPRLAISDAPQKDTEIAAISALLMGMAALVLLVACLNVTNMLLARGSARRREIALRLALGAPRRRIVIQLLTESLVVAVMGGAAGLLLAVWGTALLVASLRPILPMTLAFDATPDVRVLTATLLFAGLSTIVAGLGPAWRITQPDVLPDLKEQGGADGPGRLRTRHLLVVGQVALSLALLITAGLFIRGAARAAVVDPGFPVDGELVAAIDPSLAALDETRGRAAVRTILQRVRSTPGVHSASMASIVPFGDFHEGALVQHAGTPRAPQGQLESGVSATYMIVGTDYFETVRVPVLRGRAFSAAEEEASGGPPVAVIDEPLARQLYGDDDPIGRQIQLRRREGPDVLQVIGVVRGFRQELLDTVPKPHVFVPSGRVYHAAMNLHVRLSGSGEAAESAMLQTIRQQIRAADDRVPVLSIKTLRQHRDDGILLWAANTGARLFSMFGGVALLLALVGVYGVKSYVVSRRTREIGIRMALGATRRDVVWLVLREGLWLTAVGIGVGIAIGALAAKLVSGLLYQVSALDPLVYTVAPALLAASALLAAYLPALRATRVVPTTALRQE